jgi:hypothetical protein
MTAGREDCRIVGLLDRRELGLQDGKTVGLEDFGPYDCRTAGM